MAMSEAGASNYDSRQPEQSGGGLSLEWHALEDGGCPKCREELVFFENIDMYKCPCGFKISRTRFDEIVQKMIDGDIGRGYCFGGYTDEPPF